MRLPLTETDFFGDEFATDLTLPFPHAFGESSILVLPSSIVYHSRTQTHFPSSFLSRTFPLDCPPFQQTVPSADPHGLSTLKWPQLDSCSATCDAVTSLFVLSAT